MDDNIILKTEKLKKEYGEGENAFLALNNVDLEVKQGEFLAITGESGSGKTTLLNCIGSLDRPTSGKIIFNGRDITTMDDNGLSAYRRKSIGLLGFFLYSMPAFILLHYFHTLYFLSVKTIIFSEALF